MTVRADRATAPLLTVAAFAVGPVALLAPLGLAPLLSLVAAGLAAIAVLERRLPVPSLDLAVAPALLRGHALASALWAVDAEHSAWRAVRLIAECVEGLLLVDGAARLGATERQRVLAALGLGLALLVALAVIDRLSAGELMHWLHGPRGRDSANNRGATVLAIAIWPVLAMLLRTRGRAWALGAWALAVLGVAACASASAHLALLLATASFAVAWWQRIEAARTVLVLAPALVLVMPMLPFLAPPADPPLPASLLKPSAIHRLVIWRFTDARIGERPLLGWGLDASRAIPGGKTLVPLPIAGSPPMRVEQMPLHPHNGALQLWLELGAVGAFVGALIVMLATTRLAAPVMAPAARAAGLAAFAAAAVEVSVSYGLWQSWWIAALWLCAAAVQIALAVDD